MSDALAKSSGQALAVGGFTREQVELIKKTVAPADTTDDELKLFLHVAAKAGMDPLQKQIHLTKRQGRITIIAGIDGLRARATREPDFEGLLHGVVCAKDEVQFSAATGEVVKHTYNPFADRGPILGAWATVRRKGRLPFTANVRFSEFCQQSSPTWKQMPGVMIDKVAQSTALRMAYPEQFSAIYEQAEMDQAEPSSTTNGAATEALREKLLAQVPAPTPPPAPRRMVIVDSTPSKPTPFERIRELGRKHGREGKELSSFVTGATGKKGKDAVLTDEDVDKVAAAFSALYPEPPDDVPLPSLSDQPPADSELF